jgi:TonB-dependent starch-binding outer membrane protein SusC
MKKNECISWEWQVPRLQKVFRIMKLTVFLLLLSVISVFASKSYSQTKVLNLDMKNSTVKEVLRNIEKQSEFVFMYSEKLIDVNREVSVNVKNKKINEVLDELFAGTDVSYKVKDRFILLITPEVTVNDLMAQQQKSVSGKVTDSGGQPLPGVTVVVKGTTQGTVTNADGDYSLTNISEDVTLVFSFVGMRTEEVEVGNQSSIDVTMNVDAVGIEEVVAIGYGTMRKSDLTGSVTRVNLESFRETTTVNIAQSLQGSVPGLNVGQVDQAGQVPEISIRGRSTLSGNTDVLIILDGIIFTGGLQNLNPADIESTDILKDASSKAIYGAQAANGVILITSKKGKISDKPVFNYSGSYTYQSEIPSLTIHDRGDFDNKILAYYYRAGAMLPPDYTQPNPDWDFVGTVGGITGAISDGYLAGTDFNWWDAATQPGFINTHNLSTSGSQKNFTYYWSLGHTNQQNIIINDEFKRNTARINVSNHFFDWFKLGVNTSVSLTDYSGESPSMEQLSALPPVVEPYDAEGNIITAPNGAGNINPFIPTLAKDFDHRNYINANFFADIDIPFVKGLNYLLNYGNNYKWDQKYYSNLYIGESKIGEAYKNNSALYDWTIDNILTYNRLFANKHSLNMTFLAGLRDVNYESTSATGTNFSTLGLIYNKLSLATVQKIESDAWDESYTYQMGRLNYRYDSRYLFTATLRRDGFSGFAKNHKIAYFPSVALAWLLSEEQFMDVGLINLLKIRASWGSNGNLVNRYSSLARVEYYPAYVSGDGGSTLLGQQVNTMANSDLKWETTKGFNLGLDFALFENRLYGNLEYYLTSTFDMLYLVQIPTTTGFSNIMDNIGEIANRGIEVQLGGRIIQKNQFSWDLNFNLSSNKNEIKSLTEIDADGDGKEDDLIASGLFIGESINTIYTYKEDGMVQIGDIAPQGYPAGTYRIADINNDGIYDPNDRVIIGRQEPAYRFGLLNTMKYGNFEFMFFINSIQGGKDGYLGKNMPLDRQDHIARNSFKEHDFWTPWNTDAIWQGGLGQAAISYIQYHDRSFIRLQDVSLSYNLPNNLAGKLGLSRFKAYVSARNLLTITNWIGWDPETGNGINANGLPVLRGYTFGIDLSF